MTNITKNIIFNGGDLSTIQPKKKKLNQNIIRVGDIVKIINPERVIRVGYPIPFNDACEEIDKLYQDEIFTFLNKTIYKSTNKSEKCALFDFSLINIDEKSKVYKKIVSALAYEYIQQKGFGGRERKIYTEYRQDLEGAIVKVTNIFIRKTGTYFSPSGGYDNYSGEYDYDPGGLDKMKTHKILELDHWISGLCQSNPNWFINSLCIEAINVEKIHEGNSEECDY